MKAIIIEDEIQSQQTLSNMVKDFCEEVTILDVVASVQEAIKSINKHKPDFIFLDIELPEQDGFQLFKYFDNPTFDVIFTTAYNKYALNALKISAVDYLLKPINLEELQKAILKVKKNMLLKVNSNNLMFLKENLGNKLKKIALPTSSGFSFVSIEEIIRCEANGSYTFFYLKDGSKILVSKTLKTFSDHLEDFNFFRINRAHLINLEFIESFGRQKKATITLSDGTILKLSQGRKSDFLRLFEG